MIPRTCDDCAYQLDEQFEICRGYCHCLKGYCGKFQWGDDRLASLDKLEAKLCDYLTYSNEAAVMAMELFEAAGLPIDEGSRSDG